MLLPGPVDQLLLVHPDYPAADILIEFQGDYAWSVIKPNEGQDLRGRLGIPSEDIVFCLDIWDPLGWEGYYFGLRGTYAPTTLNAATAPLFHLHVKTDPDPEKDWKDIPLVAWRRVVRCPYTPVWIEARWTPIEGETLALRGLEKDTRLERVRQAHNGIALLKAMEAVGSGRPPDMEEEAFRQMYWDAYQKILANGRRPTKTEVAAELLMPTKTLKRNRDRYNLPWPPLSPH